MLAGFHCFYNEASPHPKALSGFVMNPQAAAQSMCIHPWGNPQLGSINDLESCFCAV